MHKSRGWTIYFSGAFTGHPSAPAEVQSFSVPDLSPTSMGTLEDAIRAELDARSSGQEAKEGNLSG